MGRQYKKAKTYKHEKRAREDSLDTSQELKTKVAVLEGELFDLHTSHCDLLKEVTLLRQQNTAIKEALDREIHRNNTIQNKTNDLEQYTRRNNLRIFGINDTNPNETALQSEHLVAQLCKQKLGYNLQPWEVEVAHRTGKFMSDGNRPIIIRLVSRKTRSGILSNRRKLKGTPQVIAEDLTRENLQLYKRVRDLECVSQAWARDGKIYAKSHRNEIKEIKISMVIDEQLFDASRPSGKPSSAAPTTTVTSSVATNVTSSAKSAGATGTSAEASSMVPPATTSAASSVVSSATTTVTSSEVPPAATAAVTFVASSARSSAGNVGVTGTTKEAMGQTRGPQSKEDDMDEDKGQNITNNESPNNIPEANHTSTPKTLVQPKLKF